MDEAITGEGLTKLNHFFSQFPSVQYVRLHWQDFSGVLRARFIPKWRALQIAKGDNSYTLAQNCMIVPVSTAPEAFPEGPERWELHPDWDCIRVCGFRQNHAAVMCFVDHCGIPTRYAKCPRTLLQSKVAQLNSLDGGELMIGFEIEFVLLDESGQLARQMDRIGNYSTTSGLRTQYLDLIEKIVEALAISSIQVYHFHGEVADQLEIALAPLPPVEAVDAFVFAQETIRTVFARAGLKATMCPQPVFHGPQNGIHMHLSITPRSFADSFLAGIMDHMKSLCSLGMPNVNSYVRTTDDGAGLKIGWGTENRDLPVRKIAQGHWEFRTLDSTSNVYLFLAALIAAGVRGIESRQLLELKDTGCFFDDKHKMSREESEAKYGITEDMPRSLQETLDSLKKDTDMQHWIGEAIVHEYVKLKEIEIEKFQPLTDEERRLKFIDFF